MKRGQAIRIFMNADECEQRALELFGRAESMAHCPARQGMVKEACEFRALAEFKRMLPAKSGGAVR